jgi:diaminobutyrate-2-oxoglutarate transaminase
LSETLSPPAELVFERSESEVRSYCRSWPVVLDHAKGARLRTRSGQSYLDFFAGAGALNYGHNPGVLKRPLLDYLERDGLTHGLDMYTEAKRDFLQAFEQFVLGPRELSYKVQFCGPTGTNAVESALKLARKATGRPGVVNFTDAFHGMTLGALAVTGNAMKRQGSGVPLEHVTTLPYDGYLGGVVPDFAWFEKLLDDAGSGLEKPAAAIVETVQGEGGLNVARGEWLALLADVCHRHDVLLIVDDVQMGVGRTGPFFSFEPAGIEPDIVCLSKSISGYGFPMALCLIRPELDVWSPGEHNGTFRGFNPAFVTAAAALREFWADDALTRAVLGKGEVVAQALAGIAGRSPEVGLTPKGRGLARGLSFARNELAAKVAAAAFDRGLLMETAGTQDEVAKVMPPLTVTDAELDEGLAILDDAVRAVVPGVTG